MTLKEQISAKRAALKAITAKAAAEQRELTAAEQSELDSGKAEIEELRGVEAVTGAFFRQYSGRR
jgi:hypothetical protein